MNRTRHLLPVIFLLATIATVSGCGSSDTEELNLVSGKPEIVLDDVGAKGPSIGDRETFHATVTKDGKAAGELYGSKLLVALPGTMGAPANAARYQNQMTFVLDGGLITVEGVQDLPTDPGKWSTSGASETRAVTGGTGDYAGVGGTVTSTTQPDGSRTQRFSLNR